jgi:hypothetical protein
MGLNMALEIGHSFIYSAFVCSDDTSALNVLEHSRVLTTAVLHGLPPAYQQLRVVSGRDLAYRRSHNG